MKLYYPITVDLYNLYPLKKMDAQQGNIGRGTLVTLTAAGQVMEPDNETITLWAKKPDGKVSYLPCQVTGGKIKADFTNQMLAAPGAVQVELQMIDGEDNITTPIFTITVHPSNIDSTTVESQNEFTVLQTAIENMNTALQEVDELKKTGLKGDPGEPGKDGAPGAAATVGIGTVEASDPGSDPQVTNSGTANAAILNFVLPRGQAGPPGADGKEQVFFGAYADFPAEGNSGMLYVDTSNTAVLLMYRWNGTAYIPSGGGAADLDVVAQEFDATKTYAKGEYVIYSGGLYCFTSDKAAGEWDSAIVTPTTVVAELNALNAKIEWKLLGKKSSPTHAVLQIPIPEDLDFSELCVVYESYNAGNYIFNIPRQALTPNKGIRQGFYSSANLTGFASLNVSATLIQMGSYNQNGVAATNVVMTVYYR